MCNLRSEKKIFIKMSLEALIEIRRKFNGGKFYHEDYNFLINQLSQFYFVSNFNFDCEHCLTQNCVTDYQGYVYCSDCKLEVKITDLDNIIKLFRTLRLNLTDKLTIENVEGIIKGHKYKTKSGFIYGIVVVYESFDCNRSDLMSNLLYYGYKLYLFNSISDRDYNFDHNIAELLLL